MFAHKSIYAEERGKFPRNSFFYTSTETVELEVTECPNHNQEYNITLIIIPLLLFC
jgi:hypothetical protein